MEAKEMFERVRRQIGTLEESLEGKHRMAIWDLQSLRDNLRAYREKIEEGYGDTYPMDEHEEFITSKVSFSFEEANKEIEKAMDSLDTIKKVMRSLKELGDKIELLEE